MESPEVICPNSSRWSRNGRLTSADRMINLALTIEKQIVQSGGTIIKHRNNRDDQCQLEYDKASLSSEQEIKLQSLVNESSAPLSLLGPPQETPSEECEKVESAASVTCNDPDVNELSPPSMAASVLVLSESALEEHGDYKNAKDNRFDCQASSSTVEIASDTHDFFSTADTADCTSRYIGDTAKRTSYDEEIIVNPVCYEEDDGDGDDDSPGFDLAPECILQEGDIQTGEILTSVCGSCGFSSGDVKVMEAHRCTSEPQVRCPYCFKSFKRAETARRHARVAHPAETRPLACPDCTFRTRDTALFERHVMRHKGIKFCECDQCDYKTDSPKSLRIHKLTHTGEKPFACHLCDYRGTQRGHLQDHIRLVHIKSKDFPCPICGTRFGIKGAMKRHIKNIHEKPDKTFTCEECGYTTPRRDRFREHTRSHSGEKPFACTACNYRGASRQSLDKHAKGHLRRAVKALALANNSSPQGDVSSCGDLTALALMSIPPAALQSTDPASSVVEIRNSGESEKVTDITTSTNTLTELRGIQMLFSALQSETDARIAEK